MKGESGDRNKSGYGSRKQKEVGWKPLKGYRSTLLSSNWTEGGKISSAELLGERCFNNQVLDQTLEESAEGEIDLNGQVRERRFE